MRQKNISFLYRGKKINLKVFRCNPLEKIRGLTFRRRDRAKALLFEFKKNLSAIHSYFVFFPFIAIWLDKNNKVIEIKKVKPFTFHILPKKSFDRIIEIPINNRYRKTIKKLGF
jgi:uncharacterized membrane protein (UPF0127 family)